MVKNIKEIILEVPPNSRNNIPLVKVVFNFPCEWSVFNIEDLKQILRLWIRGELMKYPRSQGFKGGDLLKEEILKVFKEEDPKGEIVEIIIGSQDKK